VDEMGDDKVPGWSAENPEETKATEAAKRLQEQRRKRKAAHEDEEGGEKSG
jgi:hypothetical protein